MDIPGFGNEVSLRLECGASISHTIFWTLVAILSKPAGYETNIYTATEADCSSCINIVYYVYVIQSYAMLRTPINHAHCIWQGPRNTSVQPHRYSSPSRVSSDPLHPHHPRVDDIDVISGIFMSLL